MGGYILQSECSLTSQQGSHDNEAEGIITAAGWIEGEEDMFTAEFSKVRS